MLLGLTSARVTLPFANRVGGSAVFVFALAFWFANPILVTEPGISQRLCNTTQTLPHSNSIRPNWKRIRPSIGFQAFRLCETPPKGSIHLPWRDGPLAHTRTRPALVDNSSSTPSKQGDQGILCRHKAIRQNSANS